MLPDGSRERSAGYVQRDAVGAGGTPGKYKDEDDPHRQGAETEGGEYGSGYGQDVLPGVRRTACI